MAVTKIHPIKSTLDKALAYICNPEKTDEKILISSFGCSFETADIEFQFTIDQAIKKGDNLAHHLIQSFDPGEVSYEEAYRIGKELADTVTEGKYEYVLSTHIDKGHIHNHIMFCAVDFMEHKKYVSNRRTYYNIRNTSDRLCKEHGLSVVHPGKEKGKGWKEYTETKAGTSWKAQLTAAIDRYIVVSTSFDDMLRRMEADSFTIKRAKYTSYKLPGQGRFTGGPTLGSEYTDERIKERIDGLLKAPVRRTQRVDDGRINLVIDIENSIKAQQSKGYEHWAKINNLKQAARTVNFLTENNLLRYEDLQAKIAEVRVAEQQAADTLKQLEKRINDMGLLTKNISTYQRTKPAFDRYRQAGDKDKYRQQHETDLILHEAARKALAAVQTGGKLPSLQSLKTEHEKLTQEKSALYQEYNKLKKQMKELDTVKTNIDRILNQPGAAFDKEKSHTL